MSFQRYVFFFQAEDGIRDDLVTGVQTCALPISQQPGEELAQAVGLDMAAWWQPTAEGYFKHVPKAAVLQAVGEYAPDQVSRLAKLKKADIASEAERLADGAGWMPAIFKVEGPQQAVKESAQEAGPEQDAPEDAEAM